MVLLTLSAGWCYAWSLFAQPIAQHIGAPYTLVQCTFCLNILLLGLGAAFFGNIVERHIKFASLLSTMLLGCGFLLLWVGLHFQMAVCVMLGGGVLCGIAEGIAYVVSPKNLLLWWSKTRFKATIMSLSIICFGLGSSLCTIVFKHLHQQYGLEHTVLCLCGLYLLMMLVGSLLVQKPKFAQSQAKKAQAFDYHKTICSKTFVHLWIFMFLNISAGLMLIGNAVSLLESLSISSSMVVVTMMLCGISNGLGRLVFPVVTDFMKKKMAVCLLILGIEICIVTPTLAMPVIIPLMLVLVNATYGSGFAVLPSLVSQAYGNSRLTTIHGLVLSAWGIASLFSYACMSLLSMFQIGISGVLIAILLMYVLNFVNAYMMNDQHKSKAV